MIRFDPRQAIAADLSAVDACIRTSLASDVALIDQVAHYIIGSGGKRLRPVLLLLVAAALGRVKPQAHTLAAVVELIHTATLLHDDVVDESGLRRGRKTANAVFGNAASVLVGDFLYSRAFQMMVSVGDMEIMRVLADATNTIAEGEVLQLMNIGDDRVTEESYLRVIRYKTAKLFEAAGRIGAMVAGADTQTGDAMAEYGMRLGTAFQLVDDVLDYSGDVALTGKNLGDDLAEGKPTLPLLRVLATGSPAQQAVVRAALTDPGNADFKAVIAALRNTDALDYTARAARAEAERAASLLSVLPAGQATQTLLELSSFAVERSS
ncbi:MAG: polyprenyl synthetase family protein [Burkholderiales bacterium]|nr:polyprenyl synthetase family protein [Burkholderiales bacterium]